MIKDNEKVYDEEIFPLMTKIMEICKKNEIPLLATFAYAPDQLCTSYIPGPASDPESEILAHAKRIIHRQSGPAMNIKVLDKDGNIKAWERVLG